MYITKSESRDPLLCVCKAADVELDRCGGRRRAGGMLEGGAGRRSRGEREISTPPPRHDGLGEIESLCEGRERAVR